jgi:hypothetical protein
MQTTSQNTNIELLSEREADVLMNYQNSIRRVPLKIRPDPAGQHTSVLTDRPVKHEPAEMIPPPSESDPFSPMNLSHKTPEPRYTYRTGQLEATEFPNLYPYLEGGCVAVTDRYPRGITEIDSDIMLAHLVGGQQFALRSRACSSARGMVEFKNWGRNRAFSSQPRIHSQRGLRTHGMISASDQEQRAWDELAERCGCDPFPLFFDQLESKDLTIKRNDRIVVAGDWAPTYPEQVDVYAAAPVPNYLAAERDVLEEAAVALGRAISLLADRNVTEFNLVTHSAPFDYRGWYRLHWHIFPRNLRGDAGAEVGERIYVIAVPPEKTALALREGWGLGSSAEVR